MIADVVLALVLIVLSGIWIAEGIGLGLWIPGVSAGSGFIPAAFAALTLISSLYVIASSFKKKHASAALAAGASEKEAKSETQKKEAASSLERYKTLIPVIFCLGGIFCLQLFGLVITVALISFLWMRFVSRMELKKVLVFTVAITLFIYLVFEAWLKIPFPGDIIRL